MYITVTIAEHTDQLRTPTLGMVLVTMTHMRRFVQSDTSYHVLHYHFLRGFFGTGILGGVYRGMTVKFSTALFVLITVP